ncbi:cysteinyl-tRNA synthetase [Reticulomyxa filosa]|uniref:Cysteinyl-tRNA synthetase n=1 Tax=Reticulomyxa filosa TaxID=46433 RepID=X6NBZ5_RETFI|nr:cysteinyl-tRNA synthetase [Reticulomyxa filosa]|eukprot:ETO22842.1 cysteinyl-tRNA synthetase [Reticulomyxa filosa]
MSKSLKNFITIRDALKMSSSRQIRLLFILQSWHGTMDYSDASLDEVKRKEHELLEFFLLIRALNRQFHDPHVIAATPFGILCLCFLLNMMMNDDDDENDGNLDASFNECILSRQAEVDKALRDNFDYPKAMKALMDLMSDCHSYLKNQKGRPHVLLLNKAADYVNDMLKIFGVTPRHDSHFLGNELFQKEQLLRPILDIITQYRYEVLNYFFFFLLACFIADLYRKHADTSMYEAVMKRFDEIIVETQSKKSTLIHPYDELHKQLQHVLITFHEQLTKLKKSGTLNEVVKATDKLRDETLPLLGVKLADTEEHLGGSIWKLYSHKPLSSDDNNNKDVQTEKNKVQNRIKQLNKDLNGWTKKITSPKDLFASESFKKEYLRFDEKGFPTHDASNKLLSKNQIKKLHKLWQTQEKLHKQYLDELTKNPTFFEDLKSELAKEKNKLKETDRH